MKKIPFKKGLKSKKKLFLGGPMPIAQGITTGTMGSVGINPNDIAAMQTQGLANIQPMSAPAPVSSGMNLDMSKFQTGAGAVQQGGELLDKNTQLGSTVSGIGKGAQMGASLGPIGMAGGAIIGGIIGGVTGKKKEEAAKRAQETQDDLDYTAARINSDAVLRNYDTKGTGVTSFANGGLVNPKDSFIEDVTPIAGGNITPISENAVAFNANSNGTDTMEFPDFYGDNGETAINTPDGPFIFSEDLKRAGSKESFAAANKKIEKQKNSDPRFSKFNEFLDNKNQKLAQEQEEQKEAKRITNAEKYGERKTYPTGLEPWRPSSQQKYGGSGFFENPNYNEALKEGKATGGYAKEGYQYGGDPEKMKAYRETLNLLRRKEGLPNQNWNDPAKRTAQKVNYKEAISMEEPVAASSWNNLLTQAGYGSGTPLPLNEPTNTSSQATPQVDPNTGLPIASSVYYGDKSGELGAIDPATQTGIGGNKYSADPKVTEMMNDPMFAKRWMARADPTYLARAGIYSEADLQDKAKITKYQKVWNAENSDNPILVDGKLGEQTMRTAKEGVAGPEQPTWSSFDPNSVKPNIQKVTPKGEPGTGAGKQGIDVGNVGQYASDVLNMFTQLPDVPKPSLQGGVRLERFDNKAELAKINREGRGLDKSIAQNTAQAGAATAARGNTLAKRLQAGNESNANINRINTQVGNTEAGINAQIDASNIGTINRYKDVELARKLKQQEIIPSSFANLSEKMAASSSENKARELDRDKFGMLMETYKNYGISDRTKAGLKKETQDKYFQYGGLIKKTRKRRAI